MLDSKMFGEVPQKIHNVVVNTLESLEEKNEDKIKKANRIYVIARVATIFCVVFLVTGITVSSVGVLRQKYKERMQEMTHEDFEEFYELWDEKLSRDFTVKELERYHKLEELYEKNGVFPKGQVEVLEGGELYNGKGIALDIREHILYLPGELSDEDLLQLIDYRKKHIYSVYMLNEERINAEESWRVRVVDMTPEEMEEIYKMWVYSTGEVTGAFCRNLSEEEWGRYNELEIRYEEEGLFPEKEICIIRYKEEYTGQEAAFCVQNGTYYFPKGELTDEQMLQMIDFTHKASYAFSKIADEINFGLREGFPIIVREYEVFRQRMEALAEGDYEMFGRMEEKSYSRELTVEEAERYRQWEDSYKRHGVFPEGQITLLAKGENYSGIGTAFDSMTGKIYLPTQEMSDEELLQLIDFRNKCVYSEYMLQVEANRKENAWIERVELLDYGAMIDIYLRWQFADTEVRGGFSRELSIEEKARYDELERKYEKEGLFPEKEVKTVGQKDLIGEGVTFYSRECMYYLPEEELTDEELLQIIDFTHKAIYVCDKIDREVNMGLREAYNIYR